MGDTLTHLSSPDAVRRLFSAVAAALAPGGLFILTWRDLTPSSPALTASSPSAPTTSAS